MVLNYIVPDIVPNVSIFRKFRHIEISNFRCIVSSVFSPPPLGVHVLFMLTLNKNSDGFFQTSKSNRLRFLFVGICEGQVFGNDL